MTLNTNSPNLGVLVSGAPGDQHFLELLRQWRALDALVQPSVIARIAAVPTSGVVDGDRYLLTTEPNSTKIARYSADANSVTGWEYYSPKAGWRVHVVSDQTDYQFVGGAWIAAGSGGVGPASTDDLPEGSTNRYWTAARTLATAVAGLVTSNSTVIAATDTVLIAFGKLQAQITSLAGSKLDTTATATAATKLVTARKINGVAFDGTADITISGGSGGGPASTDDLPEGSTNRYWTAARTLATALAGLVTSSSTVIAATDTVLIAFGKLQAQITSLAGSKLDTTATATAATKLVTARKINGVAFDGTADISISGGGPASTDDLPEGSTNRYWTAGRTLATALAGLVTSSSTVIAATDTVLTAFGKLQAQITSLAGSKLDTTATATAATKLVTARKINGVAFDGTADVTIVDSAALPKSGGIMTGPITSTSGAQFSSVNLTSTTDPLITGGAPHTVGGAGTVLSLARDDALISEFMSCGTAARFNIHRAGGTQASPTIIGPADTIGFFQFLGYNGSSYFAAAAFSGATDGAPVAGGPTPGLIRFITADASGSKTAWQMRSAGHLQPGADNVYDVGSSSLRARVIYAGTGTISTSDAREKTVVRVLTSNEISAAKQLAREIGSYRFLSAISEKGPDAREHIGMTVQRAIEVMETHELDPFSYGFICHDTWEESLMYSGYEEDGERPAIVTPAGDRYSFRVDELCLFLAAGFEARLTALRAARVTPRLGTDRLKFIFFPWQNPDAIQYRAGLC